MLLTELHAGRLRLTPLSQGDAEPMVAVLADVQLYTYIGGSPPSLADLLSTYARLLAGPQHGSEEWANWIIRLKGTSEPIGYVQATVTEDRADLAWLVGVAWQGRGYAREAATTAQSWLGSRGIKRFFAHIHPDHGASNGVASAIGLEPSGVFDADGEMIWASGPPGLWASGPPG